MLSTLYLLKYNNYYNRILKKERTLEAYIENAISDPIINVNFVPNDGITTEQIIPNYTGETPDYLIEVQPGNQGPVLKSRWFVIEAKRTRDGQYRLTLFKDLLAEYYDEIVEAPIFLEKGYVGINDSAIFNDEQITVNQIKENEILLKDPTNTAWIVGYCAPYTAQDGDKGEPEEFRVTYGIDDGYSLYSPTKEDWDLAYLENQEIKVLNDYNFDMRVKRSTGYGQVKEYSYKFKQDSFTSMESGLSSSDVGYVGEYLSYVGYADSALIDKIKEDCVPNLPSDFLSIMMSNYGLVDESNTDLAKILSVDGLVIKIGETRYGISIEKNIVNSGTVQVTSNSNYHNAWNNYARTFMNYANQQLFTILDKYKTIKSYNTEYTYTSYKLILTDLTTTSGLAFDFPTTNRKILKDAPYCMFCLPYGNLDLFYNDDSFKEVNITAKNSMYVAMGCGKDLNSRGVLYDLQLLPYCPIPAIRENMTNDYLDLREPVFSEWESGKDYLIIPGANTAMFFADTSQGTFDIALPRNLQYYSDTLTFKTNMLCRSVRLCSPNYNGIFEFNAYKNGGCTLINVDYTYKPFQPYIHLNPNFGRLYGKDFDDARGLICGGDFSLSTMTDRWQEYQAQNKTYQEQFNRQIENMEVQHKYGRIQDITNAVTGTVGGTTSGAMTGAVMGGGPGAIVGGIIGGGASLAGGIADVKINEALRNESLDYTKDLFSLQLENIKALPNSLTRVSSLNANNKIFPFIEEYNATDEEIRAVASKLKYNGFTIGRIGTLQEAINNKPLYMGDGYFKGQLIRLENLAEDSHIVNVISSELYKGVYI